MGPSSAATQVPSRPLNRSKDRSSAVGPACAADAASSTASPSVKLRILMPSSPAGLSAARFALWSNGPAENRQQEKERALEVSQAHRDRAPSRPKGRGEAPDEAHEQGEDHPRHH